MNDIGTGDFPLTATARATTDAFDPVRNNPLYGCLPRGMPTVTCSHGSDSLSSCAVGDFHGNWIPVSEIPGVSCNQRQFFLESNCRLYGIR